MENIIVKDLSSGFVNLKAKKGYSLFSIRINRVVSEAVVKAEEAKNFVAIKLL